MKSLYAFILLTLLATTAALASPVGSVYQAGITWYDLQHNVTQGRSIGVDATGNVHVAWTHMGSPNPSTRHIRYNVWNPTTELMQFSGGVQVDGSARAGFTTLGVTADGFAIPAFHQFGPPVNPQLTGAVDFMPRTGAFIASTPPYLIENEAEINCIWPKIALDNNNTMHVVSVFSAIGDFYYSRGIPVISGNVASGINWDFFPPNNVQFVHIDSTTTVSPDIAASMTSQRIAIAYANLRPGAFNADSRNNDLFLIISDDAGDTWNAPVNLTQFADIDSQRVFGDLCVFFDDNDNIHVAFTTCLFHEQGPGLFTTSPYRARIYHWSENTPSFSVIASNWTEGQYLPGQNKLNLAIPSLSVDALTGHIFCSYQKFSQDAWSDSLFASSDAWVSVSTDNGLNWSAGRNVTDTNPLVNPAPAGQLQNERDITMSTYVTYSGISAYLNLFWQLDLDAGTSLVSEGVATENPLYYQRIPTEEIPFTPLVPNVPLHDIIAPISNLTIVSDDALSFTLRWSSRPNANTYWIYKSSDLDNLFSPLNFYASAGDTFFTCPNCLVISPTQEYFGVIAARVIETTAAAASTPSNTVSLR